MGERDRKKEKEKKLKEGGRKGKGWLKKGGR